MTNSELVAHITHREQNRLPLHDGDPISMHDRMRWISQDLDAVATEIAKQENAKRRHWLFRKVYAKQLDEYFGLEVDTTDKSYSFGGYRFYPETNEILIDGYKIDRGFKVIDKILRSFKWPK